MLTPFVLPRANVSFVAAKQTEWLLERYLKTAIKNDVFMLLLLLTNPY